MRKQKVYLETTLFNYYFDEDRDAHADTVRLFEDIAAEKYEAYTSAYILGIAKIFFPTFWMRMSYSSTYGNLRKPSLTSEICAKCHLFSP